MKIKVASAKVTRDPQGRKGARLQITTPEGEKWAGVYTLDTHGLTEEQITERITQIGERHAKKSIRFDGFRDLCAEIFEVGGAPFRISDCRLVDVGVPGGDVELSVYARRMVDGTNGERIGRPWFPLVISASDVERLPSDALILSMVASRIIEATADEAENVAIKSKLKKLEQ